MTALSDVRVKRWLKKSASDQYLYAKSLTSAQRDALEQTLAQMMRSDTPQAQQAMTMWLSIQQARLRTHAPWHQEAYRRQQLNNFIVPYISVIGTPMAVPLHLLTRTEYYRSLYRPEYPRAFNNFMSVIADPSLSQAIRRAAVERLDYHARREGTIAMPELMQLRRQGAESLAASGYRIAAPSTTTTPGVNAIFSRLEDDLAVQTVPLGAQIMLWQAAAQGAGLEDRSQRKHWYSPWAKSQSALRLDKVSAFNAEENALSFARLLARRQASAEAEPGNSRKILQDGLTVIREIAKDADLRAQVFAMAEDALGTCRDRVSEGFAAIVNTVGNHKMAQAVKAGRINQKKLQAWAGQQFRLSALEKEVEAFLQRAEDENLRALEQQRDSPLPLVSASLMDGMLTPTLAPDPSREALVSAQQTVLSTMETLRFLQDAPNTPGDEKQNAADGLAKLAAILDLLQKRLGLIHEPVETKMHAKVRLRKALDLPDSTVASMVYSGVSALNEAALKDLEKAVRKREANPTEMADYLLSNDIWSTGMRQLHASQFDAQQKRFEADRFYDLMPPEDDADVAAIAQYAEMAQTLAQRIQTEQTNLLLQCAGLRTASTS